MPDSYDIYSAAGQEAAGGKARPEPAPPPPPEMAPPAITAPPPKLATPVKEQSPIEKEVSEAQQKRIEQVEPGSILSVQKVGGDLFEVRSQLPDADKGVYRTTLMSETQVQERGGEIPIKGIWGSGAGTRWASPDTVTKESIARKEQTPEQILAQSKAGLEDAITQFAKERNITPDKARQDIITYLTEPEKFTNVWRERGEPIRKLAQEHGLLTAGAPIIRVSERGEKELSFLTPEQILKLQGLEGEKQFLELQKMGIYPSDYTWIETPEGGGILTGEQVDVMTSQARYKKSIADFEKELPGMSKDLQNAYKDAGGGIKGVEAYNELLKSDYVEYPDGYVKKQDVAEFMAQITDADKAQRYIKIANTQGWDKMIKVYEKEWGDTLETIDEYNRRVKADIERDLVNAPKILKEAYEKRGIDGYNEAVSEYNEIMAKAIYYNNPSLMLAKDETYAEALQSVRDEVPSEYLDKYADYIQPNDVDDKEYAKVREYVKPWGVQVYAASMAGVSDDVLKKVTGFDDRALKEAKWIDEYRDANWAEKQYMLATKEPLEYVKAIGSTIGEIAITMIPLAGTEYMRQHPEKYATWEVGLSAGLDVLVIAPEIKAVSTAIKGGKTFGGAILDSTLRVGRGTITPFIHPLETVKTMVRTPINIAKMVMSPKNTPLAAVWRGTYEDGWSIAKVLAGNEKEAMATRLAMEKQFRLIESGKVTSGVVKIPGFGELRFSSTGIQKGIPNLVFTATPFGAEFKGVGLEAKGAGLFTADQALLGLERSTASGKTATYVMKGDKILGALDETGKMVDTHGKIRGELQIGQNILDLKGKKAFILGKDGAILDKSGNIIGELKDGGIWTSNPQLIGKYYNGTTEWYKGKFHTINSAGMLMDSGGKVVAQSPAKVVGFISDGSKVVGDTGKVIGKIKSQPSFVMIRTSGLNELPENIAKAENMAEMEKQAWKAFSSGEYTNELYPVFKQYAKWIEDEAILPKGSRLIPVLDESGKPFVMKTTDEFGRTIEMPMLQIVSKEWFEKSKLITQQVKELSKTTKPKVSVEEMFSVVEDLPKAKKVSPKLVEWFRNNKNARLVGSTVEYIYTAKYKPGDIDMGVLNPRKAANELSDIIRKEAGVDIKVINNSDGTARLEYLDKKSGMVKEIANIKYADKEYDTVVINGVRMETPSAQIERNYKRMMDEFGGKGYVRWERFGKALGGDIDIGIGAKPPSSLALRKIQARGIWNTVRDMFIPALTKDRRLKAVEELAPDLVSDARKVFASEDRVNELRSEYIAAQRMAGRVGAKSTITLGQRLVKEAFEYDRLRADFEDRIRTRALLISTIDRTIPENIKDRMEYLKRRIDWAYESRPVINVRRIARYYKDIDKLERIPAQKRTVEQNRILRNYKKELRNVMAREGYTPRYTTVDIPRISRANRMETQDRLERIYRGGEYDGGFIRYVIPEPKKSILLKSSYSKGEKIRPPKGAIVWCQGLYWVTVLDPHKTQKDIIVSADPPIGAVVIKDEYSPYKTIQSIGEDSTAIFTMDYGNQDIFINKPSKKPGKVGAIKFQADIATKTMKDISVKGVRAKKKALGGSKKGKVLGGVIAKSAK